VSWSVGASCTHEERTSSQCVSLWSHLASSCPICLFLCLCDLLGLDHDCHNPSSSVPSIQDAPLNHHLCLSRLLNCHFSPVFCCSSAEHETVFGKCWGKLKDPAPPRQSLKTHHGDHMINPSATCHQLWHTHACRLRNTRHSLSCHLVSCWCHCSNTH